MSFNSPFGNQDQDANKAPFNPSTPPQAPAYGSAPQTPSFSSVPKPPAYGAAPQAPAAEPATPEFNSNPYAAAPAHTGGVQPTGKNSTMSVLGLVFAILFPLLGLILSIVAWKQAGETGDNRGLAKAGIIVGSILLALNIIFTFVMFGAAANVADSGAITTY